MNSYHSPVSEWDANDVFGREPLLSSNRFPPMKSVATIKAERKRRRNPGDLVALMDILVDRLRERDKASRNFLKAYGN